MKKIALAAAMTVALAGCSKKAQDSTATAGNAVAADVSNTSSEAVTDVDAATRNALDGAGNSLDNAADATANVAGNASSRLKAATGRAMQSTGNTMAEAGKDVRR